MHHAQLLCGYNENICSSISNNASFPAFFEGLIKFFVQIAYMKAWIQRPEQWGHRLYQWLLVAGIWGTLSLGLFATGAFGLPTATGADSSNVVTGLFYGGSLSQLGTQALGSGITLVVSLVMMYALNYVGVLRVSNAGELEGLDLHEHGAVAYPDCALVDSIGHNGTPSLIPTELTTARD